MAANSHLTAGTENDDATMDARYRPRQPAKLGMKLFHAKHIQVGPTPLMPGIIHSDAMWEPPKPAGMAFVIYHQMLPRPVAGFFQLHSDLMQKMLPRSTQINQTEALAAAVAPYNLPVTFKDRDWMHFVGNRGALAALVRGCSPQEDVATIVAWAHLYHAKQNCRLYYEWVESDANISDGISRYGFDDVDAKNWHTFTAKVPNFTSLTAEHTLETLTELFGQ